MMHRRIMNMALPLIERHYRRHKVMSYGKHGLDLGTESNIWSATSKSVDSIIMLSKSKWLPKTSLIFESMVRYVICPSFCVQDCHIRKASHMSPRVLLRLEIMSHLAHPSHPRGSKKQWSCGLYWPLWGWDAKRTRSWTGTRGYSLLEDTVRLGALLNDIARYPRYLKTWQREGTLTRINRILSHSFKPYHMRLIL